jgi:hypothetical protein
LGLSCFNVSIPILAAQNLNVPQKTDVFFVGQIIKSQIFGLFRFHIPWQTTISRGHLEKRVVPGIFAGSSEASSRLGIPGVAV